MEPKSPVDPSTVEQALTEAALRSPGEPRLALYRAWPTWKGGWSALYRPEAGDLRSAWGLVSAHLGLPDRVHQALASGAAVLLPTLRCFAVSLSTDPRLPHLVTLGDSVQMRRELAPHLPRRKGPRIRYCSYKPLYRVMIEYRFGRRPGEALFLKAQTRWGHETVRRVYEALSAAAASDPSFARPLTYLPKRFAIVWPETEGESLRQQLRRGDGGALEGAARALAKLHRESLDLDRQHDRQQELVTVARWTELAAHALPESRSDLGGMLQALEGARDALPAERFCTAHRDFHDDQLLIDRGRPVLLDLDTVAHAEPELDVGNFLAHLGLSPGGGEGTDLGERFLLAYLRHGLPLDDRVLEWYRISALLRLACVYAFRPGSEQRVPGLLHQTAAAIDRLQPKREVVL